MSFDRRDPDVLAAAEPDRSNLYRVLADQDIGSVTVYADRASINDRFSTARILEGVPRTDTPFMTENCGRVYFSALGYVFWVQHL